VIIAPLCGSVSIPPEAIAITRCITSGGIFIAEAVCKYCSPIELRTIPYLLKLNQSFQTILGITLLPESIYYKQNNPNIKIIPLTESALVWELGIITKKDSYHSFALRELLKLLAKGFQNE
jgi:hypothetical protein